jgi:hypothetical protein
MDLNQKLSNFESSPENDTWQMIESRARQEGDGLYDMKITPAEICWEKIATGIDQHVEDNTKTIFTSRKNLTSFIRYAAIITGILIGSISLSNKSIRTTFMNAILESNIKTTVNDTKKALPQNNKKIDSVIKINAKSSKQSLK